MKKILLLALCLLTGAGLQAKKVKFSVDMSGDSISPNGVHVTGDFQDEAGYAGGDWMPGTTLMFQETSDTNIYSVVVDIPAFAKYEFKFVNGDQGYEQEFVPYESRVNFNFIDSRWIYVDSLANDTLDIGAIRYGGNAPKGKYLLRFYVDMQNEASVSGNGAHVAGNFQSWSTNGTYLYSFDGLVYEYIAFIDSTLSATAQEFKYLNGNSAGDYETVPSPCANGSGNREVYVTHDTLLATICYSACVSCASVGMDELAAETIRVYPNPVHDQLTIEFAEDGVHDVRITDMTGRVVLSVPNYAGNRFDSGREAMPAGIYFVCVTDESGAAAVRKIAVE